MHKHLEFIQKVRLYSSTK